MKRSEAGQGLVEYALVLVLIPIVYVAILTQLGQAIDEIFCIIRNAYEEEDEKCGETTDARVSFTYQPISDSNYKAREKVREKVEAFQEDAEEQEESLEEAAGLFAEAFVEGLEVLIEYAAEIKDQELFETLTDIRQAIEDGNFDGVSEVIEALNEKLVAAPQEVRVAVALKTTPRLISACQEISGKTVSINRLNEALQAVAQLEEEYPGSTDDAAQLLNKAWGTVDERNIFIKASTDGLAGVISLVITGLKDIGNETNNAKLVKQVEKLEAASEGCGDW